MPYVCLLMLTWAVLSWVDAHPRYNSSQKHNVKILTPGNYGAERGSLTYVRSAMDFGVSELQSNYPSLNISHIYLFDNNYSDCLSFTYNVDYLLTSQYYDLSRDPSSLIVIILPGCIETLQVARLAYEWNVLVVIGVYPDPLLLTNKGKFPNTILASPVDGAAFSLAYILLYRLYEWDIICAVVDTGFPPSAAAVPTFKQSLSRAAVAFKHDLHFKLINSSAKDFADQLDGFLDFLRVTARVVQIIAHTDTTRKLLIAAHKKNMTNGDYVFLLLDTGDEIDNYFGNYTWKYNDAHDEVAFQAFKSALLLSPPRMGNEAIVEIKRFSGLLSRQTSKVTSQLPAHPIMASSFERSMYSCMIVFGQVLEEYLGSRPVTTSSIPASSSMAALYQNHTFETSLGRVYFDSVGIRRTALHFSQISIDERAWTSVFTLPPASRVLEKTGTMQWISGRAPRNAQVCGFHGEHCATLSVLTSGTFAGAVIASLIGCATLISALCIRSAARRKQQVYQNYRLDLHLLVQKSAKIQSNIVQRVR